MLNQFGKNVNCFSIDVTYSPLKQIYLQTTFAVMEIAIKVEINGRNQSSEKIPEFYFKGAESYWDDIEIHPVKEIEKGVCETTEKGDEDFCSVYFHQLSGGLKCVADVNTKEETKKLAALFDNAAKYRVYSKSH